VVGLVPDVLAGKAADGAVSHLSAQVLVAVNAYPVAHAEQIFPASKVQAVPVAAVPFVHVQVLAAQTVAAVTDWLESPAALFVPAAHAVQTPAAVT
jgi:hypothetical protein